MGLTSRKIFPTCMLSCFEIKLSRQPVKRFKKLLAEIFPKSLIAKYLEERCFNELRVERIKFINIVWERFTRLAAEAEAAKIERDNARRMETKSIRAGTRTDSQERIAKRKAEKNRVAARTTEEKVHKFRIALITSWVMIGLYFVILA